MLAAQSVQPSNNSNAIAAQAAQSGGGVNGGYLVVRGDCLWKIARAHGVSLNALIAANPQIKNPDLIYPGDTINIPSGGAAGAAGGGGQVAGGAAGVATATGGASAPAGSGDPGTHSGRINAAVDFFVSKGWSRNQAIGIVANLEGESGMRPLQAQYGGGPGFGLAQWEGPRQADFKRWAGHDIRQSTFREQLEFIQHELTTTESGAANRLRGASSAADAAALVCRYYERPADIVGDSRERMSIANNILSGNY